MKRTISTAILLVLTATLLFSACAKEELPEWEVADSGSIDTTLYEPGNICFAGGNEGSRVLDAPGILLYFY